MKKAIGLLLLLLTIMLFSGCNQPPVCGNNICELGENQAQSPTYCPGDCGNEAEFKMLVLGAPRAELISYFTAYSDILSYDYMDLVAITNPSEELGKYDAVWLDLSLSPEKDIPKIFSEALENYVKSDGKLVIVKNSGLLQLQDISPVDFQSLCPSGSEKSDSCKQALSINAVIFRQDWVHPIMKGVEFSPASSQLPAYQLEVFNVRPVGKEIAYLETTTGEYFPGIVEKKGVSGGFVGKVIYFNYEPHNAPKILRNTLLYLSGQETEECICSAEYDPVCGTDGETYSNSCYADCEGVEIDYQGECEEIELACTDSDGGLNYSVKGTCFDSTYPQGIEDICYTTDQENYNSVKEMFCNENDQCEAKIYKCPNGCENGSCVEDANFGCTDSDGGRNIYVAGTAVENDGGQVKEVKDKCVPGGWFSDFTINEAYCEDNQLVVGTIPCLVACDDGACPGVATECTDSDSGQNEYTTSNATSVLVKYVEGEKLGALEGSGGKKITVSFDSVSDNKADFSLMDGNGNLIDTYSASQGAYLNQSFVDAEGNKPLESILYVSKIEENSVIISHLFQDYCESETTLFEYGCYPDLNPPTTSTLRHECGYKCENGKCVKEPEIITQTTPLKVRGMTNGDREVELTATEYFQAYSGTGYPSNDTIYLIGASNSEYRYENYSGDEGYLLVSHTFGTEAKEDYKVEIEYLDSNLLEKTLTAYFPAFDTSSSGKKMYFYVATDGSTYYGDAENDGINNEYNELLTPEEAFTGAHLARKAE